jgi:hypothetical protein
MKSGGSQRKGSAFERKICKALSLWVSKGRRRDLFWRSAMSGGRAKIFRRQGHDMRHQAGDICSVSPDGHVLTDYWCIECKIYRDLQLDNFIFGLPGPVLRFWKQTCDEAHRSGRHPMLIAQQWRGPIFVVMSPQEASHYDWSRQCYLAHISPMVAPSFAILSFDGMISVPYNLRIRSRERIGSS